ncbi:RNA polymerase sigma-70 factor (TIGR02952 family) [Krasilnikovia cinnamomea]|uniref:RNA polymerase sigma factor SigS n=2 Tax=Krasilnikovia cinnamomea TaxID=349313 RepID=A0A4Q7Z923_9ACTN|nr:RNA polymerase sigma-70 factor (TIGR02952 family) [Krasilnikovia cinnamomea]
MTVSSSATDDSARFCRGALTGAPRRPGPRRRPRQHIGDAAAVPAEEGQESSSRLVPRPSQRASDHAARPTPPAPPVREAPRASDHDRPNREEGAAEPAAYPAGPDPTDPAAKVWQLVVRAQAGDQDAFGQLYHQYVDTVFRFVYFRVGNRELAEDLTSDTFMRAFKRIGSYTWQGRDLGAWLVTIARNLAADHFKSGRYRLEVTTDEAIAVDGEDRTPEGNPETAVVDHITHMALFTAVKQLNPEQQQCITLRFLQGLTVAETARTMDMNESAVKALQYRSVRALARLLPEGFDWGRSAPSQQTIDVGLNGTGVPAEENSTRTDPAAHPSPAATVPKPPAPEPPMPIQVTAAPSPVPDSISARVRALPEQQRAIYMQIVEEGKTAAEVARSTGLAPSTVRVHLSRANRALAAPLPRQPQPPPEPTSRRRYIATDFSGTDVSPMSLMRLPKGQRDVVRRFLDGASRKQIAADLGISETTVRSQLCKAMQTLRSDEP